MNSVSLQRRWIFPLAALFLFATAAGAGAMAAEPARPADPVAAWGFDDAQGQVSGDSSGHGNDVLIRAGRLVGGIHKTALELDGRKAWASCTRGEGLSPTKAVSIEAWIQPRGFAASSTSTVVRKDGAYALRFTDDRLGFLLWIGDTVQGLVAKKTDWTLGQWYHLAATYDGRLMRIFIDGREAAGSPRRQTGLIDVSVDNCGVGAYGGGGRFHGLIDEARVYARALTPEEIAASYAWGLASAESQKDAVFKPQQIGLEFPVLKKPARKVTMVQDGFLWIDAEDMADYGGWRLDTQFVHLVGSGYLIAVGTGTPVKDATTAVDIPKAGKYRLWVRAKNWYKPDAPGKFRVSVGDQQPEHVFGTADREDWIWEAVGPFDLPKGPTRIALHDLTGYYGRCDALVLTTDLDYTPPAEMEGIEKERSRLTGLSLEPKPEGDFDVIVVGAGAAGSCAALASARMGCKTALVQDRPVLGGNASIELGVPINGAASMHANARESGIIEEAGRVKARYGFYKMSEPLRVLAEKEKNLTMLLNHRVIGAEMKDAKTIARVTAVNTLTGQLTTYGGKMFVDSTGDGWLGYYAGAKFRHGRESRDEFNESLAPEKEDGINMSGCLMGELCLSYRAEDTGHPVKYAPPSWAAKLPPPDRFGRKPKHLGGQWWLEREGTINTLWDAEKSRDELIRISYGYWDYIKNHWDEKQRAANHALVFVPITEGKRESRRLVGDYILNQNDVQNATVFPDRVSYGGWPMDVHHAEGIYSGKEGPFHCNDRAPIYTIPFRSLYSVNVDNLLFAGRNMSVTHIALGTVRVQGTLAALGQAAGTGAALCVEEKITPRHLCLGRTELLQQTLLKYDQYIPELRNEDPKDLARKAQVTASSTGSYEEFGRESVQIDDGHALSVSRAMMFPRGAKDRIDSVFLRLESSRPDAVPLTLHLREAARSGDFSAKTDLATATATVPPNKTSYVEFPVNCRPGQPYVWVWLPRTDGIVWSLMEKAPLDSCRAYGGGDSGEWTVVKGQYHAFTTRPALAFETDYRPENVINGVTRIVDKTSNLWVSDPAQPLPQWIELDFDAPRRMTTVYLTFDTDMNAPFHTVPLVRQCVREYKLSYYDGSKWVELAHVADNFQRRRMHRFDPFTAEKLRLTVEATNGAPAARVFEIRAYDE